MAPDILERAMSAWRHMEEFRRDRDRNKRFTYGDQWCDMIRSDNGMMREEDFIRSQGNVPLKNNLTRRLVRNVLGVFRNRWQPPTCEARDPSESGEARTMQTLLRYNTDLNRLEEVYARTMEEFLISGLAIHKKWYGARHGRLDCWTDIVSADNFFVDADARDCRGWDFSLLGELHDLDFNTLCASFATSSDDEALLRQIYSSSDHAKCRVIEAWTRDTKHVYLCHNLISGRYFECETLYPKPGIEITRNIREIWRFYFLSPAGHILSSGMSPYSHRSHPYVIKAYPFVDGEIHSFVSDIIDQQKFANRLISMYDWILRSSAKGVLLFPEGALPAGVDMSDVAQEWSRFNGVIVFKPRPGMPLPQQVSSNATNIGITELLNIQMKMMEDISGVNGALQGKLEGSSISGTLYDQQTRNSLTALADLMKSFDSFITDATERDASNIRQFYSPQKIAAIAGDAPSLSPRENFFDNASDFVIRRTENETTSSQEPLRHT